MNRLAKRVLGGMVVAIGLAVGTAQANLLVNGGFETGDFTGWTQSGNTGFTGVECPGHFLGGPFEGFCDAFLGPVGSDGFLAQTVNTIIGRTYAISFALETDGGTTSDFGASFGATGTTLSRLFSVTNPPASPYVLRTFLTTATAATSDVRFNFSDNPGFLFLDAVSVNLPEPGTMALLAIGMTGLLLRRRKTL